MNTRAARLTARCPPRRPVLPSLPGGSRDRALDRSCHPRPPAARPTRPRGRPAAARTLPLAAPPARRPPCPRTWCTGLARIDASGRVADRTVTRALGWHGGDRLTLTASAGVVTARRDPDGLVTLPPRHYIAIPATLRHRCGLLPGDPVLLAAVRRPRTRLTAYSLAVVDQALAAPMPVPGT